MTENYELMLCPLPVVRQKWNDERDDGDPALRSFAVESCGAEVILSIEECGSLYVDGEGGDVSTYWKVECVGGHVLLMPDYEGNDVNGAIKYRPADLLQWFAGPNSAKKAFPEEPTDP